MSSTESIQRCFPTIFGLDITEPKQSLAMGLERKSVPTEEEMGLINKYTESSTVRDNKLAEEIYNLISVETPTDSTIANVSKYPLDALVEKGIQQVYLHPVKFELVYNELDEDFASEVEEHCADREEKVETDLASIGWDTVVIPDCRVLNMSTSCTGNDDSRGGGCGSLNLPESDFVWTVRCDEKGLTLRELVGGVYRLKGSKYDYWYEMFDGLTLTRGTESGEYNCDVDFDYGS
jgi:hypothetical protein